VLAGPSVGAIILTPTIGTAGPPLPDPDDNDVKLKNLRALGLVRFEFSPQPRKPTKPSFTTAEQQNTLFLPSPMGAELRLMEIE